MNMETQDNGYEVVATKVRKESKDRLEALCKSRGMSKYDLLQMMCDTLIRYMDDRHNLTPEMEKAMSLFEHLKGWGGAFNLADSTANPQIMEATYYLRDSSKPGVRGVHVERPWLQSSEEWIQTFNIQEILEQTICLLMPERYRRLRLLAVDNDCSSILQLIDMLIDEHSKDADIAEVRQSFMDADRSEYGKKPADAPYRRKHYKTVNDDRLTDKQHTLFGEDTDINDDIYGLNV